MRTTTSRRSAQSPVPDMIARAVEVFIHGFTFTRSFTHLYLAERIGPVWVMRDAPRTRGNYRTQEWVALDVAPEEVDRIARKHTRGRFAICAVERAIEASEPLRAGFKELGYRLGRTEPLMVHHLSRIARATSIARIERVMTQALADQLAKAARSRQMLPEHLAKQAPLRQYIACIDDEIVGWVRSIVVGDATWCSDMYVRPEYRRRGIARAMLCRMLRDDRGSGATSAVLTASHTGAKLYAGVGYEQVGTVSVFTPIKR